MIDATGMSDSALDAAYANAWDTKQYTVAHEYGSEIISRLSGVWSFVSGVFGNERFPKYSHRVQNTGQTFTQTGATRDSVAVAAKNVADGIGTGLKFAAAGYVIAAVVIIAIVVSRK